MPVVLRLSFLVRETPLMGVERYVIVRDASGDIISRGEDDSLRQGAYGADRSAGGYETGQLAHGALAHAINNHIGMRVDKDTWAESVLPVVIMGQPAHGSLYATEDDGCVRI